MFSDPLKSLNVVVLTSLFYLIMRQILRSWENSSFYISKHPAQRIRKDRAKGEVLVLNSILRLNCLVVWMSTMNLVAAHLETCPVQEGSMHFIKFMEMKVTTNFHFLTAYLIDSEKKFIQLIAHEIHTCDYRDHFLLILLLCSVIPSRLACLL